MTPCSAVLSYSRDELAAMVWLRTGKNPTSVRCQALLVVAEFADGTTSIHQLDDLERPAPRRYGVCAAFGHLDYACDCGKPGARDVR